MIKIHKYSFLLLISLCCLSILTSCEQVEPEFIEPSRPSSAPHNSVWVGGIDGGVFISISKQKRMNQSTYLSEIYYVSGDLSFKGVMQIFPKNSKFDDFDNPEAYQGWDGDTLYLSKSRYLKVIE